MDQFERFILSYSSGKTKLPEASNIEMKAILLEPWIQSTHRIHTDLSTGIFIL